MKGALVPAAILPRFTSYAGPGSFATAPLEVTPFGRGDLVFWRGPLVGGAASDPFRVYFEESHDAIFWTEAATDLSQPVIAANRFDRLEVEFTKRWFRVRTELAGASGGIVGITMWLTGGLELRVQ
jgi:hypothetical protein